MASRTAILRGPAMVQFSGADFFSQGDIEFEFDEESLEVIASAYGKVDERVTNRIGKVRFTPAGEWESLSVLFPYASTVVGASLFTGSDVTLTIWTLDGRKIVFAAAAITKMPDLTLSAVKPPFGQVEFTCIGKDNTSWATANSFVTVTSVAFPASTFDPAAIKMSPFTAVWTGGATPWDGFQSKDGFNVTFNLKTARLDTDSDGLVDHMFESLDVMVKARAVVTVPTPGGITEQSVIDALFIQGAGAARGKSYQSFTNNGDLTISATGQTFTLKAASIKGTGFKFGATEVRQGETAWIATRKLAAGVVGPLFAIS